MGNSFTYWQDPKDGMFLGYWSEYPDYMTQGHSFDELKEMLMDIRGLILDGTLVGNRRCVAEMSIA